MSSASMPSSSAWTVRSPGCVVSRNSRARAESWRASSASRVVTQARSAVCTDRSSRSARMSIRRWPSTPGIAAARPATSAASGSDPVRTSVLNSPRTYRQPSPVTAAEASARESLVCSMPPIVPALSAPRIVILANALSVGMVDLLRQLLPAALES